MGTFHIVMGVVLLIAGVIGFIYFNKTVGSGETIFGLLGRALSPEVQQQYQNALIFQMASVALGIIGIVSLIYGFVRK